jgi:hypothetical protein
MNFVLPLASIGKNKFNMINFTLKKNLLNKKKLWTKYGSDWIFKILDIDL